MARLPAHHPGTHQQIFYIIKTSICDKKRKKKNISLCFLRKHRLKGLLLLMRPTLGYSESPREQYWSTIRVDSAESSNIEGTLAARRGDKVIHRRKWKYSCNLPSSTGLSVYYAIVYRICLHSPHPKNYFKQKTLFQQSWPASRSKFQQIFLQ